MKTWLAIFFTVLLLGFPARADYPQRIVSGMPSVTEMLYALDLEDQIVGVTSNCNYPPEVSEKEKVGDFFLNLEKVVSLKPDLVIMIEDAQRRDIKKFKDYGLEVYTIHPKTVVEVMSAFLEIGKITGRKARAEQITDRMVKRILTIEAKVKDLPRVKVIAIVGLNPLVVVGGGNFINDILRYAGARNIAENAKAAYPQYSYESLVEKEPEYIIIASGNMTREQLQQDSRLRSLNAVKYDRIIYVDEDVLSRPGPRVVEAIKTIAEFIHEEKKEI
jgi:iron complex transport system substrate-binding protein